MILLIRSINSFISIRVFVRFARPSFVRFTILFCSIYFDRPFHDFVCLLHYFSGSLHDGVPPFHALFRPFSGLIRSFRDSFVCSFVRSLVRSSFPAAIAAVAPRQVDGRR